MNWKLHLLCLGAAIPFGIWGTLMKKTGIANPALTAMILFAGSMIPFLWRLDLTPSLRPETSFAAKIAIAGAFGVAVLHGLGHRSYQPIITLYSEKEVANANVTIFFEMFAVILLGNYFLLDQAITVRKVLAVMCGVVAIVLYTS